MTIRLRHLPAALGAVAALAAAGCGGSDEPQGAKLPPSSVSELNQRLDEIQRRYDDAKRNDNPGACDDIQQDSFGAVSRAIDGLPADVDAKLRDAVTQSFANLQQLTDEGCKDVRPKTDTETTPTETAPPVAPTPAPAPQETTPTETAPPETTPQEPKKPKQPKDDGKQDNGGSKPQGGNGGGTQAPSAGGGPGN
ncbi:MAG: hypothetical protein ACR2J6_07430 [Thermoleophilaceae bacterium]